MVLWEITKLLVSYIRTEFIVVAMIVGMGVMLHTGLSLNRKSVKAISIMIFLDIIISLSSFTEDYLVQTGLNNSLIIPMRIISYLCGPWLMILMIKFIKPDESVPLHCYIVTAIHHLIFLTPLFSPVALYLSEEGVIMRGPLGFAEHIIIFYLLTTILILLMDKYDELDAFGRARPVMSFGVILVIVAGTIDTYYETTYIPAAVTLATVFFFLILHLDNAQVMEMRHETMLKEQKNALRISQIQPHFIYNALNIIYYLCLTAPEKAAETVDKFSEYLRVNLDRSLSSEKPIPLMEEIKHTMNYADIEMLRFDHLKVDYEIYDTDFCLPALSIQPMVENAIRHGVRNKENGHVVVRTFKTEKEHVVQIIDNGIGQVSVQAQTGNHEHVGIPNVRSRIQEMCKGTLDINMKPDEGTTVTIRIPDTGEKKEKQEA